jgi:hypothetical protein
MWQRHDVVGSVWFRFTYMSVEAGTVELGDAHLTTVRGLENVRGSRKRGFIFKNALLL